MLRISTVCGKDSRPGIVAFLFVWTELRLRCVTVSHDGAWTGGAKDCDWRRSGAKCGVPGRQAGEGVSAYEPGCYIKHGI